MNNGEIIAAPQPEIGLDSVHLPHQLQVLTANLASHFYTDRFGVTRIDEQTALKDSSLQIPIGKNGKPVNITWMSKYNSHLSFTQDGIPQWNNRPLEQSPLEIQIAYTLDQAAHAVYDSRINPSAINLAAIFRHLNQAEGMMRRNQPKDVRSNNRPFSHSSDRMSGPSARTIIQGTALAAPLLAGGVTAVHAAETQPVPAIVRDISQVPGVHADVREALIMPDQQEQQTSNVDVPGVIFHPLTDAERELLASYKSQFRQLTGQTNYAIETLPSDEFLTEIESIRSVLEQETLADFQIPSSDGRTITFPGVRTINDFIENLPADSNPSIILVINEGSNTPISLAVRLHGSVETTISIDGVEQAGYFVEESLFTFDGNTVRYLEPTEDGVPVLKLVDENLRNTLALVGLNVEIGSTILMIEDPDGNPSMVIGFDTAYEITLPNFNSINVRDPLTQAAIVQSSEFELVRSQDITLPQEWYDTFPQGTLTWNENLSVWEVRGILNIPGANQNSPWYIVQINGQYAVVFSELVGNPPPPVDQVNYDPTSQPIRPERPPEPPDAPTAAVMESPVEVNQGERPRPWATSWARVTINGKNYTLVSELGDAMVIEGFEVENMRRILQLLHLEPYQNNVFIEIRDLSRGNEGDIWAFTSEEHDIARSECVGSAERSELICRLYYTSDAIARITENEDETRRGSIVSSSFIIQLAQKMQQHGITLQNPDASRIVKIFQDNNITDWRIFNISGTVN